MSSSVVSSTIMAMLISSDHCSPRDPDEWRQMISDNLITRPSINYDNLFVSIRASTSFSITLTAEQKYRGGELNCTFTIPHCLGRSSIYAKMKFSFSPSQKLQLTQCDSQITKRFLESVCVLLWASIPLVQVDHCEQKCISGSMEKYPLNASDSWEAGGQQKSGGLN